MAVLRPYPFGALVRRMLTELDEQGSIFDLPARKFVTGSGERDLSVTFHGREASTPFGPAAGPQSQMAQNIVLSWLAGGRIMELKTVQILDELDIPRPCIDMETVGYNVEWSQELTLEESLAEYVKGAMLCAILRASGRIDLAPDFDRVIWDMSVGYDLEGIRSERVRAFIHGMMDATDLVERYRREIPDEFAEYRDLDFETELSGSLTLSTFHGCPPDEIERIISFLLREVGLDCIVKLNPMLLGPEACRGLLHDEMGYDDLHVPDTAFERDASWAQAVGFTERLGDLADSLGLGFGVKFSNTLIVENHKEFFPDDQEEMYLSGKPLHVLAMNLVRRFRDRFGDRYPISFAAGIDCRNFADAVALGLTPITVCSDLLEPGGYGRAQAYFRNLEKRMDEAGARTVDEWIVRAYGHGEEALVRAGVDPDDPRRKACLEALAGGGDLLEAAGEELFERWVSEAKLLNTAHYVEEATADPRYAKDANDAPPTKIDSHLELFDCISCDKCVPVCPNDANFTFELPTEPIPVVRLRPTGDDWERVETDEIPVEMDHQIGTYVDFCNACGNCDVFCPEHGGPYVVKPHFFGSLESFEASDLDGFFLDRPTPDLETVHGRFDGETYRLEVPGDGRAAYEGPGFEVTLDPAAAEETIEGEADGEVDLTQLRIMDAFREALLDEKATTYVNARAGTGRELPESPPLPGA